MNNGFLRWWTYYLLTLLTGDVGVKRPEFDSRPFVHERQESNSHAFCN